jgi:predicted nuclease of predicted toxin-antitoxin system
VSVRFYFDVHVPRAITLQLRLRGVDVLTAQEDGAERLADPALLDRATELGRVLVSQDDDLLVEARRRQDAGIPFCGVVYAHQLRVTIGQAVRDLELIANVADPTDLANNVQHLPLR